MKKISEPDHRMQLCGQTYRLRRTHPAGEEAAGRTIHVFSERHEMCWGPFVSFAYIF